MKPVGRLCLIICAIFLIAGCASAKPLYTEIDVHLKIKMATDRNQLYHLRDNDWLGACINYPGDNRWEIEILVSNQQDLIDINETLLGHEVKHYIEQNLKGLITKTHRR